MNRETTHLRALAMLEACSLCLLVFVAVPLKYLADLPALVKVMGPVHGLSFVFFVRALANANATGSLPAGKAWWLGLMACVPLGGFLGAIWITRAEHGA